MKASLSLMLVAYAVGLVLLVGAGYFYLKGKPPELPQLNTTQPTWAAVSPTNAFGLPNGSIQATPVPPSEKCEDGTRVDTCNINREACLKVGNETLLVRDCTKCGCGEGLVCNPLTKECFFGCQDGTALNACSNATEKYYCNGEGQLVLNGTACGCPRGYQYDPYGGGPDTVNDCRRTCRHGEDCAEGK